MKEIIDKWSKILKIVALFAVVVTLRPDGEKDYFFRAKILKESPGMILFKSRGGTIQFIGSYYIFHGTNTLGNDAWNEFEKAIR